MRLATWNVNSLTARMPRVLGWIDEHQPDILCMQETKQADAAFPADDLRRRSATSRPTTATAGGTAWPSSAGSVSSDPVRGFDSPEDDYGCRIVAATCARHPGALGLRAQRAHASTTSSTGSSSRGWPGLASYLGETCDPGRRRRGVR